MTVGLSYDDVCMVPKYSNIASRTEPTLNTRLTRNVEMAIPIVAANMDTVIGIDLASEMHKCGSIPIFHRFHKIQDDLIREVKTFRSQCFMSVGVNDYEKTRSLIKENQLRPRGLCIDIAHGHAQTVMDLIGTIKKDFPDLDVIAGNVCTSRATLDLIEAGADAVKVGIGPGSVCTTRNVTAFGTPQFTAVEECAAAASHHDVPVIADGGIRGSREILLALGAGASSVMIGGLFARTQEAAGGGVYRGQASAQFQADYYGKVKSNTVPEGEAIAFSKSELHLAKHVIDTLCGGIRSGFTYGGARDIEEFQRKAEFMQITPGYWRKG